jgi:hypothetical protein
LRWRQVKNKTVTLLLSLLERVDSDFIPSRILEALEVDAIVAEINYQQVFFFSLPPPSDHIVMTTIP